MGSNYEGPKVMKDGLREIVDALVVGYYVPFYTKRWINNWKDYSSIPLRLDSGTPHYCPDVPHAMSKSGLSGSGQ